MDERVGRKDSHLFVEFVEAGKKRGVIHFGQFFTRFLLHFDLVLQLGKVERQRVNLGLPLHQNLRFELKSKFILSSIAAFLEPSVRDASPRGKQAAHLVPANRVRGIVEEASFASAHRLLIPPAFHDLAKHDFVATHREESIQAAVLLLLLLRQIFYVALLRLNCQGHLSDLVIGSACVLVEIVLIFAHVTSAHLPILIDQVLQKVAEQPIVRQTERLHERRLLLKGHCFGDLRHSGYLVRHCGLLDFFGDARFADVILEDRVGSFAIYTTELVKL